MAAGALLTPAGIFAMRAPEPLRGARLMGLVLFGFQVWINTCRRCRATSSRSSAVASVFGLGGTSAAIASVLYNWGTGHVVDTLGYAPMFVVAGLLGPIGLVVTLGLAGRIAPLSRGQLQPAPLRVRA